MIDVFRINRINYNKIDDPSECQLDGYDYIFDYIINNDHDLDVLYNTVDSLLII